MKPGVFAHGRFGCQAVDVVRFGGLVRPADGLQSNIELLTVDPVE